MSKCRKAQQEVGVQILAVVPWLPGRSWCRRQIVRPSPIIVKLSIHVVVIELVELLTTNIHAKLERMVAGNPGQTVCPLERIPRLRKFPFPIVADGKSSRNRDEGRVPRGRRSEKDVCRRGFPVDHVDPSPKNRERRQSARTEPGGHGVLHQLSICRMLKRLLTLAIVIEAEFIHRVLLMVQV